MMHTKQSRRLLLLVAAAAGLFPSGLVAQTITGRITSGADGAVVAGASVVVLDGQGVQVMGTATSGADGSYRVELTDPGVYLVMVERAGFANQVSSPITVGTGETTSFDLSMTVQRVGETGAAAVDQMDDATLLSMAIAEACRDRFVPGMHGIVFGAIRNQADNEPLPFIQTQARWEVRGMGTDRREVRSDEAGAYLICDVPAGIPVRLNAFESETDVDGPQERVTLRAGTMRKIDLVLPLSDPNVPGNLLGRVTDARGNPLVGAEVRLLGAARATATNERGVFVLEEVPAGMEVIEAESLGFAVEREAVRIVGGRAQELEIRLAVEPVELAPILVSVRPRRWFADRSGLEHRIALGLGDILLREDIEERAAQVLGEALRGIPGVTVVRQGGGISGTYLVQLRGASTIAGEACPPNVWLDGVNRGKDSAIYRDIQAFEIEALEVYRGAAAVPGEFSGQDARCGVIVVWTRRGRTIGN